VAKLSDGARRLAELKKETGLSDEAIGHLACGVSGVTVLHWRTGAVLPTYVYRVALIVLTSEVDARGLVTKPGISLDAWDPDGAEAAIIARAKPLAQALAEAG
jgi:hypothetical protein